MTSSMPLDRLSQQLFLLRNRRIENECRRVIRLGYRVDEVELCEYGPLYKPHLAYVENGRYILPQPRDWWFRSRKHVSGRILWLRRCWRIIFGNYILDSLGGN